MLYKRNDSIKISNGVSTYFNKSVVLSSVLSCIDGGTKSIDHSDQFVHLHFVSVTFCFSFPKNYEFRCKYFTNDDLSHFLLLELSNPVGNLK